MSVTNSLEHCPKPETPEVWRVVPGLETRFEVSNQGSIRSVRQPGITFGKVRALYTDKRKYQSISWFSNDKGHNVMLHQAVAKAFIPLREGAIYVNHIDCNPSHNCAHNLEWVTPKENVQHAIRMGRVDTTRTRGQKHGMAKLTDIQAANIKHCKGAISGIKLAKLYNVNSETIYGIWNGKRWKHV